MQQAAQAAINCATLSLWSPKNKVTHRIPQITGRLYLADSNHCFIEAIRESYSHYFGMLEITLHNKTKRTGHAGDSIIYVVYYFVKNNRVFLFNDPKCEWRNVWMNRSMEIR